MSEVLILGASGRAAAASALRAGLTPIILDLFADADTQQLGRVVRLPIEDYPHGFIALARQQPPCPFLYTGGLENHPGVVAEIARSRPLWGNDADVLQRVRDPFWLHDALKSWGLPTLEVHSSRESLPSDRRWLRKPLRGSAGLGIRFATPTDPFSDDHFYQEYRDGVPMSALFCGRAFLSMTRQLIGSDWLHAPRFRYAGNIGPLPSSPAWLARFGEHLMTHTGIRGLYGVDFLATVDGDRVLEINPRYTASVEVIERSTGQSLLQWHRQAFEETVAPAPKLTADPPIGGKAIYYAPCAITIASDCPIFRDPGYADLPHPGDCLEKGQPVCTLFSREGTEGENENRLKERARQLDSHWRHP